MEKEKSIKRDPLAKLFAGLRPTADELAKIKAAENDPKQFVQLLGELDRKYKVRSLETLGIDKRIINPSASRPATAIRLPGLPENIPGYQVAPGAGVIGQLSASNQLACDCVVPFQFQRLDVYDAMSGPEQDQVARGMLGAYRYGANEYTVWNPGDTTGKGRVHIYGAMHITFKANIPQAGRWYLIHPTGTLYIRGHSRVVGHGNMTTSYDAKVWVDYYQVLQVGFTEATGITNVEISGGEIHYDGTRSEDRTKYFNEDRYLPPRYIRFYAPHAGDTLLLTLCILVDTAANEDGLATGVIDEFGFAANSTDDYDTFVVKSQ